MDTITRYKTAILVGVLIGGFFSFIFIEAQASTYVAQSEAESGTLSGPANKVSDSNTSGGQAVRFAAATNSNGGYYVQGNKIYDKNGQVKVFHGIARPSLEWLATGDRLSLSDYQIMDSWNADVVRLSLNQRFWLQNTENYRATVAQQVQWITSLGMDVILDLHWSDKGSPSVTPAQQVMADNNSVTFWREVAGQYKSNPRVMFELYNEPHDISWSIWRNGGQADGFTVVGMQKLYDTVRETGANNLVLIGGLDWAFDLSGVPANRISGNNIAYVTHPYDFAGKNTAADWDRGFGALSTTDPIFMTEFGTFNCSTDMYTKLLDYTRTRGISWSGWAWFPGGCGFPSLITDWNGTPSAPGQLVKNAM